MGYYKNELSWRSQWHLSKHRYLELVHFCLQYEEWKRRLREIDVLHGSEGCNGRGAVNWSDETGRIGSEQAELSRKIELVERTADLAEPEISKWLLISVTQEIAYPKLSARTDVPCGKDMFYDRRRKFFWLLDQER